MKRALKIRIIVRGVKIEKETKIAKTWGRSNNKFIATKIWNEGN